MLKFRFANRVPGNAVNIGYVESDVLSVPNNVGLVDMSYRRAENLSSYTGGQFDVDVASGRVDTQECFLSPRSVLSRSVKRAIPLFFKHVIGRGTYSVAADASPYDLNSARLEILNQLEILDRFDQKVTGPEWDIEVTSVDAHNNFLVTMYLSRRQSASETFKVRYQARKTTDGSVYPNHVEVINPVPILVDGTDYTLQAETDGYSIQGLSTANRADGIGIFYEGVLNSGSVLVNATNIQLRLDDLSWIIVSTNSKTLEQVVQDINALHVVYSAVPLSDNPVCSLQLGTFIVQRRGRALKQLAYSRVMYDELTQVAALKPFNDPTYLPWYPRVDLGQFAQSVTYLGATARFVFRPQGSTIGLAAGRMGPSTHDRLDETPIILGPRILQLRRPNLIPETLKIFRLGQELLNLVADYDVRNSIVYLSRPISDLGSLYVSYSYNEDSFIYTGLDLNPLAQHSPHLMGKFIGLYLTPAEIQGASPEIFDRTLWHVVGNDIPTIMNAVDQVRFSNGELAHALLLGIYRVGEASLVEKVKVTDTRTCGGGLPEGVAPSKFKMAREAEMFTDISLWDGEPFPPTAIVVDIPSALIGTGIPQIVRDPAADPSGFFTPSGLLTLEDVQAKMSRYKAGGVVVITNPEDSLNG